MWRNSSSPSSTTTTRWNSIFSGSLGMRTLSALYIVSRLRMRPWGYGAVICLYWSGPNTARSMIIFLWMGDWLSLLLESFLKRCFAGLNMQLITNPMDSSILIWCHQVFYLIRKGMWSFVDGLGNLRRRKRKIWLRICYFAAARYWYWWWLGICPFSRRIPKSTLYTGT